MDSEEWKASELEAIIRREYVRSYFATLYHNPWPVVRRYLLFLRYRPSFLKYFVIRTWRTLLLQLRQKGPKEQLPAG